MSRDIGIFDRVLITGAKHPWRGRTGEIVVGLRRPSVGILAPMYTVRLDDGHKCMALPGDLTRALAPGECPKCEGGCTTGSRVTAVRGAINPLTR